MPVYKRPGSTYWHIEFELRGHRVRRSAKTANKQEAKRVEASLRKQLWRQIELGEKPRRTWKEAVVRWNRENRHQRAINDSMQHVDWLNPHFGQLYLDQITSEVISDAMAEKAKEPGKQTEFVTIATLNRYRTTIRRILKLAYKWEWIDRVPAIDFPDETAPDERWLTQLEAKQLMKVAPDYMRPMIEFSLLTGLRASNVLGLTWDRVDMERRRLLVPSRSSKSKRPIPVPLNVNAQRVIRGQIGKHDTHVFPGATGPIKQIDSRIWPKLFKKTGIPYMKWHGLRHTWATWHVQQGTSLHDLYALGGWHSYDMVLRYAHHADDYLEAAAGNVKLDENLIVADFRKGG